MARFKKGDKVRIIEEDNFRGMDYPKGSEAVVQSHDNSIVTLNDSSLVYADKLELITDYQPILPKVGERYRVLRKLKGFRILVGRVYEIQEVKKDGTALIDDGFHLHTCDFLTTEYLELVEEEQPIKRHVDVPKEVFGTFVRQKELKKTKQTTMQKLTSALKRVLSADKQTLYKANKIAHDLELTTEGQANYVDALFNNEGDHKKAVAEMVAMSQAELDEA